MRAPVSSLPRLSVNPGQDAGAWRELLLYGNPGLTNSATNKRTELSSAYLPRYACILVRVLRACVDI